MVSQAILRMSQWKESLPCKERDSLGHVVTPGDIGDAKRRFKCS